MKIKGRDICLNDNTKLLYKIIYTSIIINFVVESLSRSSVLQGIKHVFLNPSVFFYNTLIIMFTLSFQFLIKRRNFYNFLTCSLWIGFGIADFVLLKFRTTPFTAVDFSLITEAIPMIGLYLNTLEIILIIVGLAIFIWKVINVWIHAPRYEKRISYLKSGIVVGIISCMLVIFTKLGVSTNILASTFGNIGQAYKDYGFAYCFSNSLINTGIDKPSEYSPEIMNEIVKDTMINTATNGENKNPNVIMVQLESFFDPTLMKDISYSDDPIPNFHKLAENYSSGFVTVPSVGAGTANTEFETITGMSLDFFGPGEYPYKTILKEKACESVPYNLKKYNYKSHAIHNNDGTFYGRNIVFPNLGFDTFTSIEYMYPIEKNPMGWAKDQMLVKEILDTLESTEEKDFIYAISVQGHGKYPMSDKDDVYFSASEAEQISANSKERVEKDSDHKLNYDKLQKNNIKVTGMDNEYSYAFEYYVNQIHEMDKFIGNLVASLSRCDENVILVLFGDHLPSLGIQENNLSNNNLFETPYVMWDNADLDKNDEDIYAYQLSAKVLKKIGINEGFVNKLHQSNIEKDYYYEDLRLLQYDMLYGKGEVFHGRYPYVSSNMKMGIHDIVIDDVLQDNDDIIIKGKFFTEFSRVMINDKAVETLFIDSNTLAIKMSDANLGDEIKVAQIGDDKIILSYSNSFLFSK